MDVSEFKRLLTADHVAPADLEQVANLCRNYPSFGLAHMLRVRMMKMLSHEHEPELKRAAVYAVDRQRLYDLVHETGPVPVAQENPQESEDAEVLSFGEESNEEAEVIIEQHAPYAAPEGQDTLLELDEEEDFKLDEEQPGDETSGTTEIHAETLIEAVVKDELELEDALTDDVKDQAPGTPVIKEEEKSTGNPKRQLIRDFIKDDPGPIRADQVTPTKGDVSLDSIKEHEDFITDTLAKIYVKQRLYAKAIYAYEKLSLKYPEKSAYFAAQIEKIRSINHS